MTAPTPPAELQGTHRMVSLRVAGLIPHHDNVRKNSSTELEELAASIKEHGLLQPLVVTPNGEGGWTILAGHRRARACMLAGLSVVPCMVRENVESSDQTVLMLVENTQRKDLSPIEQALALSTLMKQGKMQKELAELVSKSQAWVSNRLGMLELPEHLQTKIVSGEITVSQAEALVRADRKKANGGKDHDRGWAPAHFSKHHPLSPKVKKYCKARGHNGRNMVGGIACGNCWETVLRQDEREAYAAELELAAAEAEEQREREERPFQGEKLRDETIHERMLRLTREGKQTSEQGTEPAEAGGEGAAQGSGDEAGGGGSPA